MSLSSGYGTPRRTTYGLPSSGGGGSYSLPTFTPPTAERAPSRAPGRFSADLTDPGDSFSNIMGEAGRFIEATVPGGDLLTGALAGVGQAVGGVADFIVPGDLGLGDVAKGTGEVLSFLSNEAQRAAARDRINIALGRSAGLTSFVTDLTGAIGQGFSPLTPQEYELAQKGGKEAVDAYRRDTDRLPDDILARARAGEDIEGLAAEMVEQNIGFSSNPSKQMGALVLADPLNLVSFGLGKIGTAGKLVRAGADVNPVQRGVGTVYSGLAAGGSGAVKTLVRATIGPATSGIVRAYGATRYRGLLSSVRNEGAALGADAERLLNINHMQAVRAVIGRSLGRGWDPILRESITPAQIEERVRLGLEASRKSGTIGKAIEDDTFALISREKPAFIGMDDGAVYAQAVENLVAALKVSPEAAARILGRQSGKALRETAAIAHGMRYGRAIEDFTRLRDEVIPLSRSGSRAVQAERLTPIAHGTLTDKRLSETLDSIVTTTPTDAAPGLTAAGGGRRAAGATETYDMDAVHAAVERFTVLREHFIGRSYTAKDVVAFLRALEDGDGVITELTKGLPKSLKAWSDEYGYGVGYAPESGWKVIPDGDGGLIVTDPFVHVQATELPTAIRNPIGVFGDSLFSAIHQRQLVLSSETRLAEFVVRKEVASEHQARAIHKAILREASERRATPRGMIDQPANDPKRYGNRVQEIFAEALGDSYDDFIKTTTPEFAFLRAMAGNLSEVGYTQKFTGELKALESRLFNTQLLVRVTEDLYPKARFRYNPFFQTQERAETDFWKIVRGITHQDMDPDVRKAILETFDNDPNFRFLAEDFGSIFLHKGRAAAQQVTGGVRDKIAAATRSLTDVQGGKREAVVQQVFTEYADIVQRSILDIDPNLWARMAGAAGSQDAKAVIGHWLKERHALMDAAKVEAELAAVRKTEFAGIPWDADMETIWNAYSYGLRRAAEAARQTQYFREGRGWLERSLNHPMLGLYPLSYVSKVVVEYGRFMLKRPFGLNAPLGGAAAVNKLQQALLIETDGPGAGLAEFVERHPILTNFLYQMLPYWPTEVTVNAPLWIKDVAGRLERDGEAEVKDVGQALLRQSALYLGAPLRLPFEQLPGIATELFDDLTRTSEELAPLR